MSSFACPICDNQEISKIYTSINQPILQNVLHRARINALNANVGNVNLEFCNNCGYIFNSDFKSEDIEYSDDYNNSQIGSKVFNEFFNSLANKLSTYIDARKGDVVEIGCGDGEFLSLLHKNGFKNCLGFEPKFQNTFNIKKNIKIVSSYFQKDLIEKPGCVDLIACRHVIEHIDDPLYFLKEIKNQSANVDCYYYFEVPNMDFIINNVSLIDIFYEHCGYYTQESFCNLMVLSGFDIIDSFTIFEEQYQAVVCKKRDDTSKKNIEKSLNVEKVLNFKNNSIKKNTKLKSFINDLYINKKRIAFWGAGAKAITFINYYQPLQEITEFIVDINNDKQGKFIAKCGVEVVGPDKLKDVSIDIVFITNKVYKKEITKQIKYINPKIDVILI